MGHKAQLVVLSMAADSTENESHSRLLRQRKGITGSYRGELFKTIIKILKCGSSQLMPSGRELGKASVFTKLSFKECLLAVLSDNSTLVFYLLSEPNSKFSYIYVKGDFHRRYQDKQTSLSNISTYQRTIKNSHFGKNHLGG